MNSLDIKPGMVFEDIYNEIFLVLNIEHRPHDCDGYTQMTIYDVDTKRVTTSMWAEEEFSIITRII